MQNQLSFTTVDVFTKTRFKGNPLAIVNVPAGKDVTQQQMQTIAREYNLSETIFIYEGQKGDQGITEWRVRIFLVDQEIPFAGHPTIGAAIHALQTLAKGADKGVLICNAGPIKIEYANGVAKAGIPHNYHLHTENKITTEDAQRLYPVLATNNVEVKSVILASPVKGMNFIMTELPNLEALGMMGVSGIELDVPADKAWEGFIGSVLYVITEQPSAGKAVKVRTRMLQSNMEDPATGSASCALSAYLAMKFRLGKTTEFELTQAVEMGRQSDIGVVITLNESMDTVAAMELSGSSVKVMEGTIEY